ncbi:MAG TPA: type II/IV secretion system ATPase subunit [Acidobacteriota bacterium]|nr:type II/IV secretion system ATPase subunit [Acidobacteriota bacterium]
MGQKRESKDQPSKAIQTIQSVSEKEQARAIKTNLNKKEKTSQETVDFSSSLGDAKGQKSIDMIDSYEVLCRDIPLQIKIFRQKGEYVPLYDVSVPSIGEHTLLILENIRQQLVKTVNLGNIELKDMTKKQEDVHGVFKDTIEVLVKKYFPTAEAEHIKFFVSYVLLRSIGLGEVEVLMSDQGLEEIAINGSHMPIWVYHRRHGLLKTNIKLETEEQIRYFATTIGRKVGRQISILEPLLDVSINVGDRVNATLMPISNEGNTITIRKFSAQPWTIADFLKHNTLSFEAAALIWHAIQYELSMLIAGGTASGKTSMLNIMSNFFPPSQRIISIEDTREIKLPKFLHWIPMLTRLPNAEGRGGVTMLMLLQNSLRMRPDRILVGEIRRPAEAEVLFEAIHTGHSVYATIHANTAAETVTRLTNPPINIPKTMIPALSLAVIQYRNRRTGLRRTFEIAEILEDGEAHVLFRYDPSVDKLKKVAEPIVLLKTLQTFSGMTAAQIKAQLKEKERVLAYLVKNNINTIDGVSHVMAEYYDNPSELLKKIG